MGSIARPDELLPRTNPPDFPAGRRPSRRWVAVAVAALAMVATLSGRTFGLGLITEPLLHDLRLDRVDYGAINFWATLLGAAFCLPWGWLTDRLGARSVLTGTLLALGAVVVVMSRVRGSWVVTFPVPFLDEMEGTGSRTASFMLDLFLLVLLTRGLGQSALSVVSLTLVGRAAGRRPGLVIGLYSFITALGFMTAFGLIKYVLDSGDTDWRGLWAGIGWVVLLAGPLAWLLVRPLPPDPAGEAKAAAPDVLTFASLSLGPALRSPAFWVFGLGTSLYGLIAAGILLFHESILKERGFDRDIFLTVTVLGPLVGLAGNLATGWLTTRWSFGRVQALAMLLLAGALAMYPFVQTLWQVYLYAAVLGLAGGMVTVIFFGVWGAAFGPAHLGQIQGAAQLLTVLASALGPLLFAVCHRATASYETVFQLGALAAGLLALAAWGVPLPKRAPATATGPVRCPA